MEPVLSAEERRQELLEDARRYVYPDDPQGIKLRYRDTALLLFKQSQDDPKSFLSFGTRRSSSVSQYGNTPIIVRRSRSSNGELATVVEQWKPPATPRTSVSNYTLIQGVSESDSEDEVVDKRLPDVAEVVSEDTTPEDGGKAERFREVGRRENEKIEARGIDERGIKGEDGRRENGDVAKTESRKSFIHYEVPIQRQRVVASTQAEEPKENQNTTETGATSHSKTKEEKETQEDGYQVKIQTETSKISDNGGNEDLPRAITQDDVQDGGGDSLPYIDAQDGLTEERNFEPANYSEEDSQEQVSFASTRSSIQPPPIPTEESNQHIDVKYNIFPLILRQDEKIKPGRREERSSIHLPSIDTVDVETSSNKNDSLEGPKFPVLKIVEPTDLEKEEVITVSHSIQISPMRPHGNNVDFPLTSPDNLYKSPLTNQSIPTTSPPLSPHHLLQKEAEVDFADAITPVSPKIDIRSDRRVQEARQGDGVKSLEKIDSINQKFSLDKSVSQDAKQTKQANKSPEKSSTPVTSPVSESRKTSLSKIPRLVKSDPTSPTKPPGEVAAITLDTRSSFEDVNKSFDVDDRTGFLDLPVRSPTPPKKSPRRSPRISRAKEEEERSSLVLPLVSDANPQVPEETHSAPPTKESGKMFNFSFKKDGSSSTSSLGAKEKDGRGGAGLPLTPKDAGGEGDVIEVSGKRVGVRSMVIDGTIKRNFIVIHPSDDSDTIGLAPKSSVSNGGGAGGGHKTPKALSSVKSHIMQPRKIDPLHKVTLKQDKEIDQKIDKGLQRQEVRQEGPVRQEDTRRQSSIPRRKKKGRKEVHSSSQSLTTQQSLEAAMTTRPSSEAPLTRTTSLMARVDCDSPTPAPSASVASDVTSRLCSVM